ncbi:hypothetical protein FHR99_003207 [Litorivivens lipolytica]|uniref:Uncharacterized protein n=1 Tax=Litorivivens lipolytica TaxID=1524264 RepID=A0A7W4Z757_9GAMM|nr:hypothetical protein [Litorivivens lipolytica]MBB3048933.1 hypothetical protein [Litorivivens lipolytica]
MRFSKTIFLAAVLVSAAGCMHEDDDDDDRNAMPAANEESIRDFIRSANGNSYKFPWINADHDTKVATNERLKQWDVTTQGLIPVKHNNVQIAIDAMNAIEDKLGTTLFDRTSIQSTPDDQIQKGIVVSYGTAVGASGGPEANACGHVGALGGSTGWPRNFYGETGHMDSVLQVNLDSSSPDGCTGGLSLDVTIHEFMHALGMGDHFDGFGFGPAIHANAWNVLHNILNNSPGTAMDSLFVEKKFQ